MSSKNIKDIFDCKKIEQFAKYVDRVLPYTGYSNSLFFLCKSNEVYFLTKMAFYKKTNPEIYSNELMNSLNLLNPHDVEVKCLTILKEKIIDANVSPCILELVYNKQNDMNDFLPTQKECDKILLTRDRDITITETINEAICLYNDAVQKGLAESTFNFLVLEQCDMTFSEFLSKFSDNPINESIFRSLMFQIIYTFYAITQIYPKFTHNDLHAQNIMLKFDYDFKFDPLNVKFIAFEAGTTTYYLPYYGIICKIIDFGFSSIPEENIISSIVKDPVAMSVRTDNDLIIFLNDIYNIAGKVYPIEQFLISIDPNGIYKHGNASFIERNKDKIQTYSAMLFNKVFNEYKTKPNSQSNIYHTYKCR
jgi:serine/threonine protein kinase